MAIKGQIALMLAKPCPGRALLSFAMRRRDRSAASPEKTPVGMQSLSRGAIHISFI
jgi:hypothetical protein